jgi:hypothetical protein
MAFDLLSLPTSPVPLFDTPPAKSARVDGARGRSAAGEEEKLQLHTSDSMPQRDRPSTEGKAFIEIMHQLQLD